MTRVTPGTRVRAAIVRASSPASAGVVCIFQLAATITSRIRRIMPERDRCGVSFVPAARSGGRGRRQATRRPGRAPAARPARAPAGPPTDAPRGARRDRPGWPRAWPAAHRPPAGRSAAGSASRPSASRMAIASSWRPAALTARCRLADSALRTRLSSPRRARETCRASTSRSAPAAPIRRRNVPTASPLFEVTTPRPRRRRHDAGRPMSASRATRAGASSGGTTNSRWVRPPARLSEPRARNRPRSQAARQ